MVIEMKGIVPPRPLTHNLFASVLEVLGVKLMRILIYKVDNGVFYSYLYMKAEETILRIDARTSDAVALALRMNAPIFVYEEILETECLKTGESTTDPMGGSEPDKDELLQEDTIGILKTALQLSIIHIYSLAICQENFRLHWGQKLVNTLRALHEVKYAQGEDEEEETADFEY